MANSLWLGHQALIFALLNTWTQPNLILHFCYSFLLTCYKPLRFWIMQIVSMAQICLGLLPSDQTNPSNYRSKEFDVSAPLLTQVCVNGGQQAQFIYLESLVPDVQITFSENKPKVRPQSCWIHGRKCVQQANRGEHKMSNSRGLIQANLFMLTN